MKLILMGLALFTTTIIQAQTSSLNVYFDFNKYELTGAARAQLDSFAQAEKGNLSRGVIDLSGHCDGIGSDQYNDQLSKRRVNTVKKYFRDLGLANSQIGD
jgi:OOP family OmpA-OmpF porin